MDGSLCLNVIQHILNELDCPCEIVNESENIANPVDVVAMHDFMLKRLLYNPNEDLSTLVPAPSNDCTITVKLLTGKTIILRLKTSDTVQMVKAKIESIEGIPEGKQRIIYNGQAVENGQSLASYGIETEAELYLVVQQKGRDLLKLCGSSLLDRKYNCDFTNIRDGSEKFSRGGETYTRPCGWYRFALKVNGKFESDQWIDGTSNRSGVRESASGEWPVSYHGTAKYNGRTIAEAAVATANDLVVSKSHTFTTPSFELARPYAHKITLGGKMYLVVIQNRVKPATLTKIIRNGFEFWVSDFTSDVRPYGICIREDN